jgi:1,4-alpha-glucan branching enzyme
VAPAATVPAPDPAAAALAEAVGRLVAGQHRDPHAVLGAHPDGAGSVVVRTFRPDATGASVVLGDGTSVEMALVHDAGVFEATVPGTDVPGYGLEVRYGDAAFPVDDPYRFWPTVGDLDLHLMGEGRHERLWEVLGRHVREHQGASAPPSRCGRPTPGRRGWSATSTAGTAACTRCAPSVPAGCGRCSSPASVPAPATSTSS